MLKLFIIFILLLSACSVSVVVSAEYKSQSISYDKDELAQLIQSKIEKGATKKQVIDMLSEVRITKFSFVVLRKNTADEPVDGGIRIRAGKKISLKGSYRKEIDGNEWEQTYYGLIASTLATKKSIFAVKSTIYLRFNFDENQRLIAGYITQETDSL